MEKLKSFSPEIIDYVEREIIPRYYSFDKAHLENHVRMVIEHTEYGTSEFIHIASLDIYRYLCLR